MALRQIIFRGKRLDNGKWVYGNLIQGSTCVCISQFLTTDTLHRIDPDTVGQYTGITDCDGNRIFEGDIIDLGNKVPSVVVFDEDAASFYLKPRGLFSQAFNDLYNVIGNIYDNKELIPQEDV